MIIDKACPAVLNQTLCPFRVGRFILIPLLVYNSNVFFHGFLPSVVNQSYMMLFFLMGAIPNHIRYLFLNQNGLHLCLFGHGADGTLLGGDEIGCSVGKPEHFRQLVFGQVFHAVFQHEA